MDKFLSDAKWGFGVFSFKLCNLFRNLGRFKVRIRVRIVLTCGGHPHYVIFGPLLETRVSLLEPYQVVALVTLF